MNISKTKTMTVSRKPEKSNITIRDLPVEQVPEFKYFEIVVRKIGRLDK